MALTTAVAEAIEELRGTFPDSGVTYREDGEGGAWVTIDPVATGPKLSPSSTWIGFHLTFPYPEADVYPLFVTPDLAHVDGTGFGEGFAVTSWGPEAAPAMQLSRRSTRMNAMIDNAPLKVLKVLKWLRA
jgi:hypothetical protein